MVLAIKSDPVPLRIDSEGAIRISDTRITLELVIQSYYEGLTAEEIAARFDTLDVGDVYSVLGYYLHHKDEVHEYLRERDQYAADIRANIEARQGSQAGLREKLLARLQNKS
jgi:uncharacterized protein (DUF433 family)